MDKKKGILEREYLTEPMIYTEVSHSDWLPQVCTCGLSHLFPSGKIKIGSKHMVHLWCSIEQWPSHSWALWLGCPKSHAQHKEKEGSVTGLAPSDLQGHHHMFVFGVLLRQHSQMLPRKGAELSFVLLLLHFFHLKLLLLAGCLKQHVAYGSHIFVSSECLFNPDLLFLMGYFPPLSFQAAQCCLL